MILKTLLQLMIIGFIFTACSSRGAMDYFNKNRHYERAMTSLQIGSLVEESKTKVIIKTIYLNHVFKNKYQDGENFYISTHIENGLKETKADGLLHELYTLELNGIKPTQSVIVDDNDTLKESMPLTESWSRYYHVRFDEVQGNDLNLTFTHKKYGTILLKYAKDELVK